ncbi:MAG: serine/threonine protein kinase, partial [Myxococcales bacterium]|nr:serine/threonine protein kinase [Myxococcales bacterium]
MARRFGAYEILYELSSGGMGAVLLGRRRGPGTFEQLVAIKTILPIHAQTELVRAMFLDEAALLARLSHPGIATVHDFGEDGGTLYMVMEYVAGIPFRDVVGDGMPPAIAARAIAEACRGVHAAHELRDLAGHVLGVVHRDISPDNLMLGFDGHVKVIDFGIALVKNRQAPVTELGTVKGKPPYMSPEQLKNEAIDRRSDVFSLAVVLWEMLTGRGLFEGDSIYAIARAVEHQEILPPSQVVGAPLPPGLDAAVMSALERDPSRRTPSAAAFAEQL